ncbi:type VI secretion system-associated FHA domain protein TagH [Ketobacter sp.]|uniref:type VI secretion system-associated FHA domain protein TagH n=1 Tax=Ketobacter sp. TaxID=2083498 RepID=UPI0025C2D3D2|nr:type VI secretion system-associated FHA domain protein TagH [Ketobacter sp.]
MTTLRLTVTSAPAGSPLAGQHLDIGVTGASLGRGATNQCVLPDNERIVSSKHASIAHELGAFVLTDHSTNGTFVNDNPTPLGPSNTVSLKDGDSIAMGKYLFTVKHVQASAPVSPAAPSGDSFLDDLGVTPPPTPASSAKPPSSSSSSSPSTPQASKPSAAGSSGLDDLDRWLEPQAAAAPSTPNWGASNVVQADSNFDEENDPLAAIDQARRAEEPFGGSFLDDVPAADEDDPDWWKGSQKDNVDPMNQAFNAPKPAVAPDFSAEPTPVPEPVAAPTPALPVADEPAVADADDLDALLGLDSAPADDMPAPADVPTSDMPLPDTLSVGLPPLDEASLDIPASEVPMPITPELTEPPPARFEPESTPAPVEPALQSEPASYPESPKSAAPKPAPQMTQAAAGAGADLAAQLAQLLELGNLDQNQLDALTPEVVEVLKVTINHLLELLRARSSIKNELRLDRTMIQPVENNPLKFALTERDALRYLFGEHSGAYMSGSKAVAEAFNDVANHQMALLAGMRSAYEKMLAKFSPEALETRFGEGASKGLLGSKKARLWDAYAEYFDKLQQDPETSFNRLFGEEFASAYETQVDDIKSSKRER